MKPSFISPTTIADSNGADIQEEIAKLHEERWPQSKRGKHKAKGGFFAGPGTSFPLEDATDVEHAVKLYGQADDPDKVKANIITFAKSHGFSSSLPDSWQEDIEGDNCADDNLDQMQEAGHVEIREACHIIEALQGPGHEVRVTVLKGGTSANQYGYDENALRQIAQFVEGAQAFADHGPLDQVVRSVRDLVGFYKDAQYVPAFPPRVEATLHIMESAGWLWDIIQESIKLGKPNLVGLSIDIFGQYNRDATGVKQVNRIVSLNSCDIVTRPSAGGEFQRILHHQERKGDTSKMDPKDKDKDKNNSTATQDPPQLDQQQTTTLAEQNNNQQQTQQIQEAALIQEAAKIKEQMQIFEEQQKEITKAREDMQRLMEAAKLDRAQVLLERRLQESILPEPVRKQIKSRFEGRFFEEEELNKELQSSLDMMAQLTSSGIVRGHNYDKQTIIGSQITESEKVAAAFDMLFDLEIDPKFGKLPRFTGIREAYEIVTGGHNVMAGISSMSRLGNIRVNESAPIGWSEGYGRVQEADTTTASFSYLLGTSMNKRLLKDYQAWPAEWQKFVVIVPIRDFKQQTRVRLGAFGSLSLVPEDSTYSTITLQDSAATYVAQKRGNIVSVSRETIINDDLQAIKQIPTKLAVAAAYTLAEFVYSFLSTNPNIYDGNALFTSGAPHSNLGSSALSSAAMQTGVTAMREQTNFAGKRLGLRPRFLIVPPELEWTAVTITKSAGVPGSANNDINPMMGFCTPIVSPQLTNMTQWFLACDPRECDGLEIGFVGGQINPCLYIQDSPLLGANFNSDLISYKIRHEYGAAVTDYRSFYRGI
jgi:phage major head subunit gpT-like protein